MLLQWTSVYCQFHTAHSMELRFQHTRISWKIIVICLLRTSAAPVYIYRYSQKSFNSCCQTGCETHKNLVFPLIYQLSLWYFMALWWNAHQKIRHLYDLTLFSPQQTKLACKEKFDRKKPLLKFFHLRNKRVFPNKLSINFKLTAQICHLQQPCSRKVTHKHFQLQIHFSK